MSLCDQLGMLQVIHQVGAGLIPVFRCGLHAPFDDRLNAIRYFRIPVAHRMVFIILCPGVQPGEHVVHGHAQRVDVGPGVCPAVVLLGRCIAPGAEHGSIGHILFIFAGDAKVDDLDVAVRLEHHVAGLHVAVDDGGTLGVQIGQHVADLHGPLQNLLFRLGAVFIDDLVQRLAFDVVHDDAEGLALINDVLNMGQRAMVQRLHHVRLSLQAVAVHLVVGIPARTSDLLDRPLLVHVFVHGEEHRGHAAVAYFFQYFIASVKGIAYSDHDPSPHSVLIRITEILSLSLRFLLRSIKYFTLLCMASLLSRLIGLRESYISAGLIS